MQRAFGIARHAKHAASTRLAVRTYKAPVKETQFLAKVHDMNAHWSKLEVINGKETIALVDDILDAAADFAENTLAPLDMVADSEGCKHINASTVKTPTGFKEAFDEWTAGEWQAMTYPESEGGQNLPYSLGFMSSEYFASACFSWFMFPGLSKGAINTILEHGDDQVKGLYIQKLVSSEWTGTMCLTEPQCGSDLGQASTKAVPTGDGKYKITGTKIFISCGDHDMTDNIVHCVLARLPDAPEGTKGLSLFAVPKKKVNADGTLGDLNGCNIGRIEDKMGCHGSPTCEINFENAEGLLIGTPHKGMNHMFTFINTSRIGTALQGLCAAEKSFQNAYPYAMERLSMRSLSGTKNPDGPADAIIEHPDVRRMLLTQKAITEGCRSMIFECTKVADHYQDAVLKGDKKAAAAADSRMAFLTPILKGFITEVGTDCASLGIQIYGGHGYIKSNFQEQILRDIRISCVWEGTTGIQALDLLGRKILIQGKLAPLNEQCVEMYKYLTPLAFGGATKSTARHARKLLKMTADWQLATVKIANEARKRTSRDRVGVASVDYLMYSGYMMLGYHWLQMQEAAGKMLEGLDKNKSADAQEIDFLNAKIKTAEFYYSSLLPKASAHKETMMAPLDTVMALDKEHFQFSQ